MKSTIFFLMMCCSLQLIAQQKERKLVIVTLDGCRWQEVFTGADAKLIDDKKFVTQKNLRAKYWKETPEERRETLMPFFWNTIARQGQLYGNRLLGNNVNVKNKQRFSYPGYNEIFTGYPDSTIKNNEHPPNPNKNVLEFINQQPGYKDRVAVFASWDRYYRILNAERSKLLINSGWGDLKDEPLNEVQKVLNEQQHVLPQIFGHTERFDASTYYIAKEYLKKNHPKVFYVAFIETDAFGHRGNYDFYLDAIHNIDRMIGDLWKHLQSDPFYKDQTTLLITTDHGRGLDSLWTSHNGYTNSIPNCDEIWFAAMGPDVPVTGEVKTPGQLYQNQVAQTIAAVLGFRFESPHQIGEKISTVFKKEE